MRHINFVWQIVKVLLCFKAYQPGNGGIPCITFASQYLLIFPLELVISKYLIRYRLFKGKGYYNIIRLLLLLLLKGMEISLFCSSYWKGGFYELLSRHYHLPVRLWTNCAHLHTYFSNYILIYFYKVQIVWCLCILAWNQYVVAIKKWHECIFHKKNNCNCYTSFTGLFIERSNWKYILWV